MAVLRLTTSIERLIEAAEYEADRVAAVSRSLFATMVLVLKWQQIPARMLRGRQGEVDLFGLAFGVSLESPRPTNGLST